MLAIHLGKPYYRVPKAASEPQPPPNGVSGWRRLVVYKKSGVRGVPKGEEGLIDAESLGRHIKHAAALADYRSGAALARAMTELGCATSMRQVTDWQRGVSVPTATAFLVILGLTAPPGGLKFFASAWPDLWPMIEQGLNGHPPEEREADPPDLADAPDGTCPNCGVRPIDFTSSFGWCKPCSTKRRRES